MRSPIRIAGIVLSSIILVSAQQNCYFGPGAGFRGPSNLVPCNTTGISTCCLLGDTCISGNACYNYATGNTYQYGCTDITYQDGTCPQKCGWDPAQSPWIGLDYCNDVSDLSDTWTCLAPESCGCKWKSSYDLQILPSRGCAAMGSEARVALYAPSTLLAYVSLPSTIGGSTGYYSTTTGTDGGLSVISTAIAGFTPSSFTQYTTYRDVPTSVIYINPGATASPATNPPAYIYTDTTPPASPAAPATSSAAPTSSTLSTTTTSSYMTHSATPTAAPASSGLSTGAKAGIGVGVAGGLCLIAALGVCWFLMARRRKNRNAQAPQSPPQYFQSPPMGGPYMQGQQPSGWAPFPPGTPYYVVPATKDNAVASISPPYSPPHSPPPPTELSTDQRHETMGDSSPLPPRAGSPRAASTPTYEYGQPRFHESI